MKCTNDNYADVKECKLGAQMYKVIHLLNSSPWVGPRSLQTRWLAHFDTTTGVCDGDGGIPKQEVAAVDPHHRLLYRLTWMYPSPYAPIACPSMPSSFISLSLPISFSSLLFLRVFLFELYGENNESVWK